MNELVSLMNQHQPQQQLMNPHPPQRLQQPPQSQLPQMLMNQPIPQQQMMNRSYGMWPPPAGPMDRHLFNFGKPNSNPPKVLGLGGSGYVSGGKPLGPRNNWKGKKVSKRKDFGRRMDGSLPMGVSNNAIAVGNTYKPPSLNELQYQNSVKSRRFFSKKNFNNNKNNNFNRGKFAPRNTSSFIIRAKKSGGITELVSPYPVTPAILPTPIFSPSSEVLVDMAKEEWGVDGYGSMKGLIRLRSPGHEAGEGHEEEESDEGGSSESDVEEHVEVERRLDHDLSRFEMIYPNYGTMDATEHTNILESRVDDQDSHIAQLEEENLILKERLFLMEREMVDLRRRLQFLERQNRGGEDVTELEETESENDSDSHGDIHSLEANKELMVDEVNEADGDTRTTVQEGSNSMEGVVAVEKKKESIERQLDNVDEAEFQVVELKEHIKEVDDVNEEMEETESENDSDSHRDIHSAEVNKEQIVEVVNEADGDTKTAVQEGSNIMQGVEAVEIMKENIEKQLDNADKAEFQVVELKEHINDTNSDEGKFKVVGLEEQTNDMNSLFLNVEENNSSSEVAQDRLLGADLSMEDVAPAGKAVIAEDVTS